jgi:hypothetical protein
MLKTTGVISWSWWWILLAPAVLGVAVGGAMAAGIVILYVRHWRFRRRARRLHSRLLVMEPPLHGFGYRLSYSGFRRSYRVHRWSSGTGSGTGAARSEAEDGRTNP